MYKIDHVSTLEEYMEMLDLFSDVFSDPSSYSTNRPSNDYIQKLLSDKNFIALVAKNDSGKVIGALVSYVLRKFEQERSEIFIYDLGVAKEFRRQKIASNLIEKLKIIGKEIGAYVIFVQADKDIEDLPAIALYKKLGTQEDVFHFDIDVS
ncbi:MAG: GNAT family N-acetyltransferase [Spirochaetia bacterium]|nr:GNAT family N-acetyltransferase [Spirochaetia bacterium]